MSNSTPQSWPVMAGSFQVGDPNASVAVCTLTSDRLYGQLAKLPGVAISGMVYTANLGIERIVLNLTTNPSIRFLLVCGRDSSLFKPGQSLVALAENGVDKEKRIIGATGYEPVLQSVAPEQIGQFRKQIELVDWTGEENVQTLQEQISGLSARSPGTFKIDGPQPLAAAQPAGQEFETIRPGGQREPLIYDPKGYFVISLDRDQGEIILRHYQPDHKPAHIMRGRGATSMLLGLLQEGLVTQLSHAGYLGEELAKAQTALQFGLRYDQDRPLKPKEDTTSARGTQAPVSQQTQATTPAAPQPPRMPPIRPPLSLKEFQSALPDSKVDIVLSVTSTPESHRLECDLLEPDEAEPFNLFHRTPAKTSVTWTPESKIIMGTVDEVQTGALLRIAGRLSEGNLVRAEQIVILTKVARIQ